MKNAPKPPNDLAAGARVYWDRLVERAEQLDLRHRAYQVERFADIAEMIVGGDLDTAFKWMRDLGISRFDRACIVHGPEVSRAVELMAEHAYSFNGFRGADYKPTGKAGRDDAEGRARIERTLRDQAGLYLDEHGDLRRIDEQPKATQRKGDT